MRLSIYLCVSLLSDAPGSWSIKPFYFRSVEIICVCGRRKCTAATFHSGEFVSVAVVASLPPRLFSLQTVAETAPDAPLENQLCRRRRDRVTSEHVIFRHTQESRVKFTALLVCCNQPPKHSTSPLTGSDTHHFHSSHLPLAPLRDPPPCVGVFPLRRVRVQFQS